MLDWLKGKGLPGQTPKYVFVVGGVMSGIGKGVVTSGIARILKAKGFKVTAIKIDPYINVDAGTMNPTEHGEVFVLEDGYETDQDMGNYERFLGETLPNINYMTTGRVYQEVIRRERNLEYKGKNVEVVPDIPLEVIRRIEEAQKTANAEITLTEVGGTIGEYQNIIFLEAARMMKQKYPHDVAIVMVSYVPIPGHVGEMKTKPTQYAARSLNAVGLQADVIMARASRPIDQKRKEKIAVFCNTLPERVISAPDVESIYDVPINYEKDGLGDILTDILGLPKRKTDLGDWETFVQKSKSATRELKVAVVGKYFDTGEFTLADSYISVLEALKHAGAHQGAKVKISYINSKDFESGARKVEELKDFDGVVVPGGFGEKGIDGILSVIRFARENKIPYFGLCYGMQLAVVEYARNVVGLEGANTVETDPGSVHPIIDVMPDQKEKLIKQDYGGTMRLGTYKAVLTDGTIAKEAYGKSEVDERHRHRYEVNPEYIEKLEQGGLIFSGRSPSGKLMEIAELPKDKHPFYLGTQFHPELLSRPLGPHPLFMAFVKIALAGAKN
ncbi:CTP synthase [Candidatus Adlerbacteria bacterium RIFCSPHIGHO2_12_FULL_53_18]|uniref:CTP synthase n=2 Tax=Parcubacteria group TaxID=1794811 RepID=A0A1F4XTT5_9BACT|nr:MAG: CTP synthase [Candidatus Adlerbacteria bacterium RIFCSPHIGHO2_12_FULL_53_18]OGG49921.1 MAG: CTP synthase [Candidatus Kaiserbacteria bacterium RIFCSPHIGHO2_01_FULL_54_36b]